MTSLNVFSDMARDKLHASQAKQLKQQPDQLPQNTVKQAQSESGLQWIFQNNQTTTSSSKGETKSAAKISSYNILAPEIEDTAQLSSTVSTNVKSVKAPDSLTMLRSMIGRNVNLGALEDSYKEYFRKSKSHNLLMERFMANVKLAGLSAFMSISGVPAEKFEEIKKEVRTQALAEIDTKLSQDWAYAKAMLEIMS